MSLKVLIDGLIQALDASPNLADDDVAFGAMIAGRLALVRAAGIKKERVRISQRFP